MSRATASSIRACVEGPKAVRSARSRNSSNADLEVELGVVGRPGHLTMRTASLPAARATDSSVAKDHVVPPWLAGRAGLTAPGVMPDLVLQPRAMCSATSASQVPSRSRSRNRPCVPGAGWSPTPGSQAETVGEAGEEALGSPRASRGRRPGGSPARRTRRSGRGRPGSRGLRSGERAGGGAVGSGRSLTGDSLCSFVLRRRRGRSGRPLRHRCPRQPLAGRGWPGRRRLGQVAQVHRAVVTVGHEGARGQVEARPVREEVDDGAGDHQWGGPRAVRHRTGRCACPRRTPSPCRRPRGRSRR